MMFVFVSSHWAPLTASFKQYPWNPLYSSRQARLASPNFLEVRLHMDDPSRGTPTPNVPTKIIPTKICWLNISGKFSMDMRIPPLNINIMLESNPLKSRRLVRRLAVNVQKHVASPPLSAPRGCACRGAHRGGKSGVRPILEGSCSKWAVSRPP